MIFLSVFVSISIILCSLIWSCNADSDYNLIVSYDEDSRINIENDYANHNTCLVDYVINYDRSDASYDSDYVSIIVSRPTDKSLRADIFLTSSYIQKQHVADPLQSYVVQKQHMPDPLQSHVVQKQHMPDNYSFVFLDNGDGELYKYAMFKSLTIYKNDVIVGSTIVENNNITILSPNISYIINQNTSTNVCPLPTVMSYYCQIIDNLTIPEKVMTAGIAVTLTSNYPLKTSKHFPFAIVISEIVVIIIVCVCVTKLMKARKDRRLTRSVDINDSDDFNAMIDHEVINNDPNTNDPDNTNYYYHP